MTSTAHATTVRSIPGDGLPAKDLERIRAQLQECAASLGGEVSARNRAARLGETYLQLAPAGRRAVLQLIAREFGPDPVKVASAHTAWQASIGTPAEGDAEAALRAAMRSARIRIMTQFLALPQGVKFLVDLRADLLRFLPHAPELAVLDRELEARLSAWFDVGFLELQRLTWHSPAALLEKLIAYEAVHEIQSWADLKNRVDSDRRCYAFFHPRMPDEPLIFVEVALCDHLAGNVQDLLDVHAPVFDPKRADTAIFYSISNTQTGLRGVSFGNFLLKRVIDDLKRDYPRLDTFATLSPLPGLRAWAEAQADLENDGAPGEWARAFPEADRQRIAKLAGIAPTLHAIRSLLATPAWSGPEADPRLAGALRGGLERLAARYLVTATHKGKPRDPVARFHLGNGARIERLNLLADTSAKGYGQSYGMMVNYLYQPDSIEENVEALLRDGTIAAVAKVRRAARD
ncbi:malonyl-CoA decarboxylase [Oryzomicrobium terrae]|uniref:Malonyl-CoA decarboxylase n=1 Tax=Oryzomicrobium terrae TaxID=1735038 RepID=A0A5C1EBN3_9RHOO|nr:malonyl-CoA decarboxylase [Oryzomicrobium terrae]QEL66411.1 malonyl-CoA decarboxylase [Oryzomicrobium terrae]